MEVTDQVMLGGNDHLIQCRNNGLLNIEELNSLLAKEVVIQLDESFTSRHDAVVWILRVNNHHGFSCLTAVLAVNYFDRFLASDRPPLEKPWMINLTAIACLSLAAKVEETAVPLLMDLQVEDAAFFFEAKTIMKMEMLVLSALDWKMHPVTPLSFIDCVVTGIQLERLLSVEFSRRCGAVVLSVISDHRFSRHRPSVLAAAAMVEVLKRGEIATSSASEFELQLIGTLTIEKEAYEDCRKFVGAFSKRKYSATSDAPRSPDRVVDMSFSADYSGACDSGLASSSVTSSPDPVAKKSKTLAISDEPIPFNLSVNDGIPVTEKVLKL